MADLDFVLDIESNGLLEDIDTIHCIVLYELNSGFSKSYRPTEIDAALAAMSKARSLICHNLVGYDLIALEKVTGWKPQPETRIIDTLLLSKLLDRDRLMPEGMLPIITNPETGLKKRLGAHGLAAWGYLIGRHKPTYDAWDTFDEEMLHRCEQDVMINVEVYKRLLQEAELTHQDMLRPWDRYQPEFGHVANRHDSFYGLMIEQDFARVINEQSELGTTLDRKLTETHINSLSERLDELEPGIIESLGTLYIKKDSRWGNAPKTKEPIEFEMMGVKVYSQDYKFVKNVFTGKGILKACHRKWCEAEGVDPETVAGVFSRTRVAGMTLTQNGRIARVMLSRGWKPTEYTPVTDTQLHEYNIRKARGEDVKEPTRGSPKLSVDGEPCPGLTRMKDGLTVGYTEVLKARSRRAQLEGFLRNCRPDGTISCAADSLGTPTGRVKHKVVTNLPKADGPYFGYQMREVFTARDGKAIIGYDVSSMESRIGWSYAAKMPGGQEYVNEMMNITDSHTHLKEYISRNLGVEVDRNQAKTVNYTAMFGAGPQRIAKTLDCSMKIGRALHKGYWSLHEPMQALAKKCEALAEKQKWLAGIDGRLLKIRKPFASMNSLIQSTGQQLVKLSIKLRNDELIKEGIGYQQLSFWHDECQGEIDKTEVQVWIFHTEEEALTFIKQDDRILSQVREIQGGYFVMYHRAGEIACQSVTTAGEILGIRVPMTSEYKIGNNLAETH